MAGHDLRTVEGRPAGSGARQPPLRTPRGAVPSPADVSALVREIQGGFDPLREGSCVDFRVSEVRDGLVCLSVVLPAALTRAFVALLDSLQGLARSIDQKTRFRVIEAKVDNPAARKERQDARQAFEQRVCELFDGFTAGGMDRKEAIKATNAELKKQGNPWAVYELVRDALRGAGRLRKSKRTR